MCDWELIFASEAAIILSLNRKSKVAQKPFKLNIINVEVKLKL